MPVKCTFKKSPEPGIFLKVFARQRIILSLIQLRCESNIVEHNQSSRMSACNLKEKGDSSVKNEINWFYRETNKIAANFDFFHMDFTRNQTKRQNERLAVSSLWAAIIFPIEWFFANNGKLKEKHT